MLEVKIQLDKTDQYVFRKNILPDPRDFQIKIVNPIHNQQINAGSLCPITFETPDNTTMGIKKVFYSINHSKYKLIGETASNRISWKVPEEFSHLVRIKVEWYSNDNQFISAFVTNVRIVGLKITAPSSGEELSPSQRYIIRWNATGNNGSIRFFFTGIDSNFSEFLLCAPNSQRQVVWIVPA